ncbi:MAG: WS/DGAT domain-containing protein, partial [Rhodospirillales bacterium]
MRNVIVGIVIGVVIGVVFGSTVVAPKLTSNSPSARLKQLPVSQKPSNKVAAGPLVPSKSTDPIVRWRMASAYGSSLPQLGTLGKRLETKIFHVSNGRIQIKFYEPGTLVPPLEMFDAVAAGAIDAAFSTPNYWEQRIPALQLFSAVPFGPTAGSSVNVTLMSYDGTCCLGINTDTAAIPDGDEFLACI